MRTIDDYMRHFTLTILLLKYHLYRTTSGVIRICPDPKDLNKEIRRPHYSSQTFDIYKIPKYFQVRYTFQKLGLISWYNSNRLTTFNTRIEKYNFPRLAFGLSLSQDISQ